MEWNSGLFSLEMWVKRQWYILWKAAARTCNFWGWNSYSLIYAIPSAISLGINILCFDCCLNNCMVFAGDYLLWRRCEHCHVPQFLTSRQLDSELESDDELFLDINSFLHLKSRAVYEYIPLIPRLRLLYAKSESAKKMRYPKTLLDVPWSDGDGIRDVWDGRAMRNWCALGMFYTDFKLI